MRFNRFSIFSSLLNSVSYSLRVYVCLLARVECVWEWLELHCTCPVCRFELETEDASYERERRVRMQGRRPRYRRTELDGLSIPQIRNLARGQNVNIAGCLEKADIVRCLIDSGTVRSVPARYSLHLFPAASALALFSTCVVSFDGGRSCNCTCYRVFPTAGRKNMGAILPEHLVLCCLFAFISKC